jgi:cytochrome c peroxidase
MQGRSWFSLRHFGLLALTTIAATAACEKGPLSDQEMDALRGFALTPLPPDPSNAAADNPKAIELGQQLFFDPGYSGKLGPYNVAVNQNGALGKDGDPGKVSCASCHYPSDAGVDRRSVPNATSLGASYTGRNAPTVINAAYSDVWQFWDGRVDSLWSQALGPPEGSLECNGTRLAVAHLVAAKYRSLYELAFPAYPLPDMSDQTRFPLDGLPGKDPTTCTQVPDPTMAVEPFNDAFDCMDPADQESVNRIYVNFGKAIAAYERQLISTNFNPSQFDRFLGGETEAMSPAAIRGARLFVGRAGCAECHNGAAFTDHKFHNIGAPQTGQFVPSTDIGREDGIKKFTAAPMGVVKFDRSSHFSDLPDDQYLMALTTSTTTDTSTEGQFKTPTLRNVAKTAPYMHDGAYQTLWDVVNHYNFGGASGSYSGTKDPAVAPLLLTDAELGDLVEFLRALDDDVPTVPALLNDPTK